MLNLACQSAITTLPEPEWNQHEVHISRPEFVALVTKSTHAIILLNLALEMMKDIEDKLSDWEVE